MKVEKIDHLVLTVKDIELIADFYSQVLGMKIVTFAAGRKALVFGDQKLNLHEKGQEFEPKAQNPTVGSLDLCFITNLSSAEVIKHLDRLDIKLLEGPLKRTGALGTLSSVYINDPEGNLIEISNYVSA